LGVRWFGLFVDMMENGEGKHCGVGCDVLICGGGFSLDVRSGVF
jgi:hypothetical protein